jgi:exonuclease SbcD
MKVTVLAVPYLRSDVVQNASYSKGVNAILRELTTRAREKYPDSRLVMMAHMYASGADIAKTDASEKLIIGGQEEVCIEGWTDHPDFLTCGHIHKRQHIWNTNWARYSGSVLPMSFAEKDYHHGVDMVTFESDSSNPNVFFLEYLPQHKLVFLPPSDEELTTRQLEKRINSELGDRIDGKLDDNFPYLVLKVKLEKVSNDDIKALEALILTKNAVLCKIQKIISASDIQTISGTQRLQSIDDILNRAPLDTLKEAFEAKFEKPMSEHQEQMLKDLINSTTDSNSVTQ